MVSPTESFVNELATQNDLIPINSDRIRKDGRTSQESSMEDVRLENSWSSELLKDDWSDCATIQYQHHLS